MRALAEDGTPTVLRLGVLSETHARLTLDSVEYSLECRLAASSECTWRTGGRTLLTVRRRNTFAEVVGSVEITEDGAADPNAPLLLVLALHQCRTSSSGSGNASGVSDSGVGGGSM